jgi:hypothetical protein
MEIMPTTFNFKGHVPDSRSPGLHLSVRNLEANRLILGYGPERLRGPDGLGIQSRSSRFGSLESICADGLSENEYPLQTHHPMFVNTSWTCCTGYSDAYTHLPSLLQPSPLPTAFSVRQPQGPCLRAHSDPSLVPGRPHLYFAILRSKDLKDE